MKPVQIGILVLVGAMGGALIMKLSQRQTPGSVPAPIVATAPVAPPDIVPSDVVQPADVAQPADAAQDAAPPPAPEPSPSPFKKQAAAAPMRHAKPARAAVATVARNLPPDPEPVVPEPIAPKPVAQEAINPGPPAEVVAPAAPTAVTEPIEPPAPAPPPAPTVTLQAGTLLPVRLGESLSSEHNQAGDGFTATLDAPLVVDGFVIAERGARVEGRVVEAQKTSHTRGQGTLALELTRLNTSDGQHVVIQTDAFSKQAARSTEQDVGIVAAAAGIGAIVGAMAGGGKGAGIGAAAGGAAGTGGVIATRAKAVALPSETKLSFRLRQAVTLTERMNR